MSQNLCLPVVRRCVLAALAFTCAIVSAQNIVINEIMYHPPTHDTREEYIELFNRGATNVNLGGWEISGGVDYVIPQNTVIPAGGYLVIAGHLATFQSLYPGVANAVGSFAVMRTTNYFGSTLTNWENTLSNTRDTLRLNNAAGQEIDRVSYADEGEWAQRQRGNLDAGFRGWTWFAEHDGLGMSLELINAALPNEHGQNWTASSVFYGTPGQANSVATANIAPLIVDAAHSPAVPRSSESVSITARVINETAAGLSVSISWRVDAASPPAFTTEPMFDDGAHGDGVAGDGLYGATIPPQPNNAIVEFFITANDAEANTRSWPAPALAAFDQPGPATQSANALYQVDDNPLNDFGGSPSRQHVYKIIMTVNEANELQTMPCNVPGPIVCGTSEAEMNASFITLDGTQPEVHYFASVKRRGHGSISANPRNYRVNFPTDKPWRDATGLILNTRQVHMQHLGAVIATQAGAAGAYTRAVQVRVNNLNRAEVEGQMFGSYAAKEVYASEWADNHFPLDDGGNIYQVVRDMAPPDFEYRGTDPNAYTNTYFKQTNGSEDDWTDIITMLSVMGDNAGANFTEQNARQVVNVEQWLTHLAVMNLMANSESGLNTGANDDYFLYRGVNDPRFLLLYHDLDSIFTQSGFGANSSIYTFTANGGSGAAMSQFVFSPGIEPLYYATLQRLLDTTFSQSQFDALVDQALKDYVSSGVISGIKTWMNQRRASVQSQISGLVPPATNKPIAIITGEPRSPSPSRNATLIVGGDSIITYHYRLNNGAYGPETSVGTPISLSNLPQGSTNTVYVIGKNSDGVLQSTATPTVSKTWVVNTNTPTVRLNEVLAQNTSAVNHGGTFPDIIELFNDGSFGINLGGLRLSDDPANPSKFTFPPNTILASGAYLLVYANVADGTAGLHAGFSLGASGEGVYLFSTNGTLIDSVEFGPQLSDLSIGRVGSTGDWRLCTPTFPGANNVRATGDPGSLRINEWLAAGTPPFADDFVELFNSTSLPIDFGNCYFTDRPLGTPMLSRVPPLSFIHSNSFAVLIADGDPDAGADHLDLALSADFGEIALFSPTLSLIDSIIYGPQVPGVTQGRCPDGANNYTFMVAPTPGSPNLCPPAPLPATMVMNYTNFWKYDGTGTNWGTAWRATNFNDSAWPSGRGLFGFDQEPAVEPIQTPIFTSNTRTTFYFRASFVLPPGAVGVQLTHIIDDGAVFYLNGQERFRFNMGGGTILATTFANVSVDNATYVSSANIPFSFFRPAPDTNYLAVEVHQINRTSGDVIFGLKVEAVTNTPTFAGVTINEVFANNSNVQEPDGSAPDWVEFYNPSAAPVDLADASLTDNVALPQRWVFPGGSIVPAGGYLRIFFSANDPVSVNNTGFGLRDTGDSLYLFASGGGLLDSVTFGLQAVDYSIGRLLGSSNWVLTIPTPDAANVASPLGDTAQVTVNEWMASPTSGEDWFELFNPNPQPVAIGEHWLSDTLTTPEQRMKYQLPKLSFIGAGAYACRLFWADDVAVNTPDHVNFKLGGGGDSIGLSAPNGTQLGSVTFGAQTAGVSQGSLPDGSINRTNFTVSQSPGDLNWLPLNSIVINEVLTHTDQPLEDAIEIQNVGSTSTNISGWFLSDSKNDLKRYPLTNLSASIPAGAFRVLYETQFNNASTASAAFALSSSRGDEVYLSAATNGVLTGYRAQVAFGAAENGVSFGRHRRSDGQHDFVRMSAHTFGVDSPATVEQFRTGTGKTNAYPAVGPIVISEIMYRPADIGTNDNTRDEFIELRNITGSPVTLYDTDYPTNRWRIRGGVNFDFPANVTLGANGTLLVVGFDPSNTTILNEFKTAYGITEAVTVLGPWTGQLANSSEEIELRRPDAPQLPPASDAGFVPYLVMERIVYADLPPWPSAADGTGLSLQRVSLTGYGNDPTNWTAAVPTPAPAGGGDSDSDGIPNSWENQYPLAMDPNDPTDAGTDYDGDGASNLQEYLTGTNPESASSVLKLAISLASPSAARLNFTAVSNFAYTVQYRTSLSTGSWLNLQSVPLAPADRAITITNAVPPPRFYRVVTP